jgi:ABC-2 type transport system ATP-binding protein
VTACRAGVTVLTDVTVAVPRGAAVALLGPNGSGKTTLVGLLAGLRRPRRGRVEIFGRPPQDWRARRRLGVVPQEISFLPFSRVGEVLDLIRAHYPSPAAIEDLLDRFELRALAASDVGRLSPGQRRRLAIAMAFAGRPSLLILDEPTAGLDQHSRRLVWHELEAFARAGGTIVLASHDLEEARSLADHAVLLDSGRVLAAEPIRAAP